MPKRKKSEYVISSLLIGCMFFLLLFGQFLYSQSDYQTTVGSPDANNFGFYQPCPDTSPYSAVKQTQVRNVILLIGDGMGLNQTAAARIKAAGLDGKLYMEKMPITGIIRTHSADNVITDSAASGTALACGIKTNNKMISMAPDGTKYFSILEAAKEKKMATGLVVTSTITHATPAVFAAHVRHRDWETQIAPQMLDNKKVNVLFGGGRQFFLPITVSGGKRRDSRDLIAEAKQAGYSYIERKDQLINAKGPFVLGLFQMGNLTTKEPEPSLAELAEKAIEILDAKPERSFIENLLNGFFNIIFFGSLEQDSGFFLMVEGSQIDMACHDYDFNRLVRQTLLFDLAVKKAIDFAIKDKNTLVLVTADHETIGLTINEAKNGKDLELLWAVDKEHRRTTDGHTGQPVPVFAFGQGAENFTGVYDNTDIPKKIAKLLCITDFPKKLRAQ